MLADIISADNISFFLVFTEGLLSFLSPCVVPLIPIYMGYLAGSTTQTAKDGTISYHRKKVFLHTVFFILGISFAFFVLGISFTALGSFFKSNRLLFTRIGGILIILLGLYQTGFFDIKFLQREKRMHFSYAGKSMNPVIAFVMGFTFSFAWTPCVGPALSSVLILASGAKSPLLGNLLVLVYTAGFTIPFLLLGLFTTQALNFLKTHQKLMKYTVKAGGFILILIGIMIFTGWMNGISRYLNSITPPKVTQNRQEATSDKGTGANIENGTNRETQTDKSNGTDPGTQPNGNDEKDPGTQANGSNDKDPATQPNGNDEKDRPDQDKETVPAYDFTLTDQYSNVHTLSDYKGKVVFLNFWATWCPPCRKEMPDIEELYHEYGENQDDVIFLGVSNPYSSEYPYTKETDKDGVIEFLDENGFTFPTVFDETGEIYGKYGISSLPTTFLIDKAGNFYGYATGMLTKDLMKNAIKQTIEVSD